MPGDAPDRRLSTAPREGEVVNRCCGKDLGPMHEHEEPSQEDIERFSGVTRTCPACKKEIFDDAELCYHCGAAVEGTAAGTGKMPVWVMITGSVALLGFLALLIFR